MGSSQIIGELEVWRSVFIQEMPRKIANDSLKLYSLAHPGRPLAVLQAACLTNTLTGGISALSNISII